MIYLQTTTLKNKQFFEYISASGKGLFNKKAEMQAACTV